MNFAKVGSGWVWPLGYSLTVLALLCSLPAHGVPGMPHMEIHTSWHVPRCTRVCVHAHSSNPLLRC